MSSAHRIFIQHLFTMSKYPSTLMLPSSQVPPLHQKYQFTEAFAVIIRGDLLNDKRTILALCLRGFQWTALAKQQPKHSVPQRWVVSFPNRPLWRSPKPLDTAWNMKMLKCIWPLSYYLYNWVCVIHWIIHEFNYVYIYIYIYIRIYIYHIII